jgi:hypothetical protein
MAKKEPKKQEDELTPEERLKVMETEIMFLQAFNAEAEKLIEEEEKAEIEKIKEKIKKET